MPFFTTGDGVRLYYEVWGSGTPAVVVEPGMFAPTVAATAFDTLTEDGLTVIAYEGRGVGRSDGPRPAGDNYSIERLTRDSLELTDHLELEGVIPLGWLDGAHRAVRRATERPGQTPAVVLFGPGLAVFRDLPGSSAIGTALQELFRKGFNYGVSAYIDSGMPDASPEQKELAKGAFRDTTASDIAEAVWRGASETDGRPLLRSVRCPALVVAGAEDIVVPLEHVREIAEALPAGQLAVLTGAGNAMWFTRTEETLDLIRAFLRSVEPAVRAVAPSTG